MTDTEINVAIARVCGWSCIHIDDKTLEGFPVLCGNPPNTGVVRAVHDYVRDLNACHEAENILTKEQQNDYMEILDQIIPWKENCAGQYSEFHLFHATARQRSEALLKTLNLWKEPNREQVGV